VTDHTPDLELLARFRAADPASSLSAADPQRVAELLEAAMSDTATRTHESRETRTHDRSPLTWLVAAAAVVVIATAGALGLAQRGEDSTPVAQTSVTQLTYGSVQGLCITPDPRVLRVQSIAFRGSLVSLVGRTARFDVSRWYAGGPTDSVEVTVAGSPGLAELVHAADLKVGREYLVAASDGNVTGCGFSGPASARLQKLYDRAFG
jgi:hypothetical protein